jgi:hypothetical protein
MKQPGKDALVNPEPALSPIHVQPPLSSTKPTNKGIAKPRLSLVERQSLVNGTRPTSDSGKPRTSSQQKPASNSEARLPVVSDIFRFPSESPPKSSLPTAKPTQRIPPKPASRPMSLSNVNTDDKENTTPNWSHMGGRERRRTFNMTMEKLAQMTREEMQTDRDWEADLASKRRRQSVAT